MKTNRDREYYILLENRPAKIKGTVFQDALKIGDRTYYYPNIGRRTFSDMIWVNLSRQMHITPLYFEGRQIPKTRKNDIEEMQSLNLKLLDFIQLVKKSRISKEECKRLLDGVAPHLLVTTEVFKIYSTSLSCHNISVEIDGSQWKGGIDTKAECSIVSKVPKSARHLRDVFVDTANAITSTGFYEIPIKCNGISGRIKAVLGKIPDDIFLSESDAKRFNLQVIVNNGGEHNDTQ